jgi:hypothetical protein
MGLLYFLVPRLGNLIFGAFLFCQCLGNRDSGGHFILFFKNICHKMTFKCVCDGRDLNGKSLVTSQWEQEHFSLSGQCDMTISYFALGEAEGDPGATAGGRLFLWCKREQVRSTRDIGQFCLTAFVDP